MFTWLKKTWMQLERKEKYLLIMVLSLFFLSVMTLLAVYVRNLSYLSSPVRKSDVPNQTEPTIPNQTASFSYDVIIYGGTPAGIAAAVAAAREGAYRRHYRTHRASRGHYYQRS